MTSELVGIFDNTTFTQLFLGAKPLSASVKEDSTIMSHPLEDGSKVSDHQIFNLVEIDIPVILAENDYVNVYQSIYKAFKENTKFTIQTKVNTYKDMIISKMPREETSISGIAIQLSFIHFLEEKASVSKISPKKSKDTNTTKRGVQDSNNTKEKDESFLGRWTS